MVLTVKQRIFIVTNYPLAAKITQLVNMFENKYGHRICHKTVHRNWKKFQDTGSIFRKKGTGRPRSVRSAVNVQQVIHEFEKDPSLSLRKASAALRISKTSIHRILKDDAKMKAYRIKNVRNLKAPWFPQQVAYSSCFSNSESGFTLYCCTGSL